MFRRIVRFGLVILALIAALVLLGAGAFWLVNRTNGSLETSGERRAYLLYVPESYDPAQPAPLVITFHGFSQWPAHQAQLSRWNDLADEYGFLVVYPSGTGFPLRWLAGGSFSSREGVDKDIRFISDLIDRLESEYNLDPARIYANGMSNGGGMTFLLSCALSERIAAVGMVAGAYLYPWEDCAPERQVPAIVFHGTADPIVPFQGGPVNSMRTSFPAIPDWVELLAERNGCAADTGTLPATGAVSGIRYSNCEAEVVFYTIEGGGHTWPGGGYLPAILTGSTTQDIDASRRMWEFFQEHPLP